MKRYATKEPIKIKRNTSTEKHNEVLYMPIGEIKPISTSSVPVPLSAGKPYRHFKADYYLANDDLVIGIKGNAQEFSLYYFFRRVGANKSEYIRIHVKSNKYLFSSDNIEKFAEDVGYYLLDILKMTNILMLATSRGQSIVASGITAFLPFPPHDWDSVSIAVSYNDYQLPNLPTETCILSANHIAYRKKDKTFSVVVWDTYGNGFLINLKSATTSIKTTVIPISDWVDIATANIVKAVANNKVDVFTAEAVKRDMKNIAYKFYTQYLSFLTDNGLSLLPLPAFKRYLYLSLRQEGYIIFPRYAPLFKQLPYTDKEYIGFAEKKTKLVKLLPVNAFSSLL
jgi:hypothetical protein